MSDNDRSLLVNSDTMASNPGRTRVQWPVFVTNFPKWFLIYGAILAGSVIIALAGEKRGWVAVICFSMIGVMGLYRVASQFNLGCVNPTQVVSTSPPLVAVYTDLTTGAGPYDVVKILPQPLGRMTGGMPRVGQRLATVALYSGDISKPHWDDFDPVVVNCVTASRADIERTLRSIPEDEWQCLEEGLRQVPTPQKPGLYPVDLGRLRALQAQGVSARPATTGASCTIVSPVADYAGIVRALRALRPNIQVVGDEHRWSQILIYGSRSTLCINPLEGQYAGDQFSQIVNGIYQQFAAVNTAGIQNKQAALGTLQNSRLALGVTATPAFVEDDGHFQCLHAIARQLNGLIFTGIALVDGDGRMVLNVNGTYQ